MLRSATFAATHSSLGLLGSLALTPIVAASCLNAMRGPSAFVRVRPWQLSAHAWYSTAPNTLRFRGPSLAGQLSSKPTATRHSVYVRGVTTTGPKYFAADRNGSDIKPTTLRSPSSNGAAQPSASGAAASSESSPASVTPADLKRAPGTLPASLSSPFPPLAELPAFLASGTVKVASAVGRGVKAVVVWTGGAVTTLVTDPARAKANAIHLWHDIKHELHHYWVGSKLFVAETRTSASLVRKVGRGEALSRRERHALRRSMGDLLRMVPFIIIVIIPFAELGLPVLLKLFPNMLPSQFEKPEYRQENYKKSLNVKLELHGILQEIVADRMSHASKAADAPTVTSLMRQLEAVRTGQALPSDAIVSVASLFKDDLALDNMPHGQLAALAKYCGLSPYAPDRILRLQLASKFKDLKADDRDLALEGTTGLTKAELKAACEARGMRAVGLSEEEYRMQLNEWLDLSVKHNVPVTVLMLSRAFSIASEHPTAPGQTTLESTKSVLQQTISSMDPRIVAEVVLDTASHSTASSNGDAKQLAELKLESIEYQNALIRLEEEAKASIADSEAASAHAAQVKSAYETAASDPSKKADDITGLKSRADEAASIAKEKAQVARAKQQAYTRLRSTDATRAAETSTSTKEQAVLEAVAAGASLARERSLLDKIKLVQRQIAAADALVQGRIEGKAAAAVDAAAPGAEEDRLSTYLQGKLSAMTAKLEAEVDAARLASALIKADSNKDGAVTQAELVNALRGVLAGTQTEEAAAALIKRLDADKDGQVTVAELERFLDGLAATLPQPKPAAEHASSGSNPERAANGKERV